MLLKIEIVSHDLTLLPGGKSLRRCYWRARSYETVIVTEDYAPGFWNTSYISAAREVKFTWAPHQLPAAPRRPGKAFSSSPGAFNLPAFPSAACSCQEVLPRTSTWCDGQRARGAVGRARGKKCNSSQRHPKIYPFIVVIASSPQLQDAPGSPSLAWRHVGPVAKGWRHGSLAALVPAQL